METLMYVAIGLATVNSVLLLGLIYVYARIAARSRAAYSFGFIIFAALLLLQNLLTAVAYATMSPVFGSEALPYLSAVGAAEFGGLLVLLRITL
jgi:hypothetical protein